MSMGYLPIFLDLGERPCIVVGGGELAETRAEALLEAGAIVTIVGREVSDRIKLQAASGKLRHLARDYHYGDLRGMVLAYVATDDREAASNAAREARERGIPLNVADHPEASTFISPATFRRGDLQIAISTSGSSPAIARLMRQRLEWQIGPEYALILEIMHRARAFLREHEPNQHRRADTLKSLAAALLDVVETPDYPQIDQILRRHLHADMAKLGLGPQNSAAAGERGCGAR
jgi:precorrin-2 dehydrogenase/sirohydrochlorin ferrochelatase